jgi:hypothetical protein
MPVLQQKTWAVNGDLLGKAKPNAPAGYRRAKDISGIACDMPDGFPRNGLVIDDEAQAAQVVTVNDGELVAGERIPLIDDTFEGKPLELDGEGVAFADGYYYVVGSHGHPRDKGEALDPVRDAAKIAARIKACSRLIRISASTPREITSTDSLKSMLRALPDVAPSIDQPLDRNGLTIEGLAVRDARAHVGLRSPLIGGRAGIASVAVPALFNASLDPGTSLSILDLGAGRGIRDIATEGAGFLVLAGPSAYEETSFAIFKWDGSGSAVMLAELPPFSADGVNWKPEGILSLGQTAEGRRVLILFDSAVNGAPVEFLIA